MYCAVTRHELHQAASAGSRLRSGIEIRFDSGQRIDQRGIDMEPASGMQRRQRELRQVAGIGIGGGGPGRELCGTIGQSHAGGNQQQGVAQRRVAAHAGPQAAQLRCGQFRLADLQQGEGAPTGIGRRDGVHVSLRQQRTTRHDAGGQAEHRRASIP